MSLFYPIVCNLKMQPSVSTLRPVLSLPTMLVLSTFSLRFVYSPVVQKYSQYYFMDYGSDTMFLIVVCFSVLNTHKVPLVP